MVETGYFFRPTMIKNEFLVLKGRPTLAQGNALGWGMGLKFVRERNPDNVLSNIRTKWSISVLSRNDSLTSVRTNEFRFANHVFADGITLFSFTQGVALG